MDTKKWFGYLTSLWESVRSPTAIRIGVSEDWAWCPKLSNKWLLWWQERKFWKTDDVAWATSLEMLQFFFEYMETNRDIFNRYNIWFLGQKSIYYLNRCPPPSAILGYCILFLLLLFCFLLHVNLRKCSFISMPRSTVHTRELTQWRRGRRGWGPSKNLAFFQQNSQLSRSVQYINGCKIG